MAFEFISLRESAKVERPAAIYLLHPESFNTAQSEAARRLFKDKRHFLQVVSCAQPDKSLALGKIDGYLKSKNEPGSENELLFVVNHDLHGMGVVGEANQVVQDSYAQSMKEEYLRLGYSKANTRPFKVTSENISPNQKGVFSFILGFFIFSILYLSLGAAYPAISVSAEESEFGTLDTIRILPVCLWAMMTGKWLCVTLIALLSGVLNLGSMLCVALYLSHQAGKSFNHISFEKEFLAISPSAAFWIVIAFFGLALVISAIMIFVASLCRSVRSAQQWVSLPLSCFIFVPVLALYPKTTLTWGMVRYPILNLVLMVKSCITGECQLDLFFVSLLSTFLIALLFIALAGKILFLDENEPFKWISLNLARLSKRN
jgi:sodium transport system permease protein